MTRPVTGMLLRHQGDRGDSLVEFAMVSVLFFMFVFGVTEFGRGIWIYNTVSNLAREGARYAAVRGANAAATATVTDVDGYVQARAYGMSPAVATTWNPTTKDVGSVVTVTVSKNFTPLTTLIPHAQLTIRSSAQMIIIR